MRPIGFSTGALALGDFRRGLELLTKSGTKAIELSALRDHELAPLMEALPHLDLESFDYVSVHVPSRFKVLSEAAIADLLGPCIERGIPVVIHPDAIQERTRWSAFGRLLCIENMDKRKRTGRTIDELEGFFESFPEASFCLDIAHARQVDPTMIEARMMLRKFGDRLRQVHISEVDASGHHERLSLVSILASQRLAGLIAEDTPIIIESMVPATDVEREISSVRRALSAASTKADELRAADWGELA